MAHFRPAQVVRNGRVSYRTAVSGDCKGFPDLVLTRNGAIVFAELKSRKGQLTPEQVNWMAALGKNFTAKCFVWRPADRDEIEKELL